MSDTIQVIRVDNVEEGPGPDAVTVWITDAEGNGWGSVVPKTSVIELTERMIGQGDPVWPAKFYISEPVPVDD